MLDLSTTVAISLVLHYYDKKYRKDAVNILFNVEQPQKINQHSSVLPFYTLSQYHVIAGSYCGFSSVVVTKTGVLPPIKTQNV